MRTATPPHKGTAASLPLARARLAHSTAGVAPAAARPRSCGRVLFEHDEDDSCSLDDRVRNYIAGCLVLALDDNERDEPDREDFIPDDET